MLIGNFQQKNNIKNIELSYLQMHLQIGMLLVIFLHQNIQTQALVGLNLEPTNFSECEL
jgi:hypothetical protein